MAHLQPESVEYQENLESYLRFSRKELQVLCKHNKLPANRSHSELAKSLASFFEKKDAGPRPLEEKCISFVPYMEPTNSENHLEDKSKDFTGVCQRRRPFDSTNKAGNGDRGPVAANNQQIEKDSGLCSKWRLGETLKDSKKYSELSANCQIVRGHASSNSGTHNSVPNIMPRAAKDSTTDSLSSDEGISTSEMPSFQFFVMSEEGLNLYVDLNSSPTEWMTSLKNETSISLKMQESKSRFLPSRTGNFSEEADAMKSSQFQDTGRNLRCDTIDRNNRCTVSNLSSNSDNCQSVAPQLEHHFGSSDSSAITSTSIPVSTLEYLDGNQTFPSHATTLSDQVIMAYDSSCPGDNNAFSDDLIDASSVMEIGNAQVPCISGGPAGTTDLEQMECPSLKNYDESNNNEINGFGNSLASISEKNDLLKSDGTEMIGLTSHKVNLVEDNDTCRVFIERGTKVDPTEGADDHDRSSICGFGGHVGLDCSVTQAHTRKGKSTQIEEKEASECERSQKSLENNSKRSHSPEFREESPTKRHHSDVENKSGMMVSLRITRASVRETIRESVPCPRRSARLLKEN
ncbi:uncharacterized protein LOC109825011 isoform X2 [Asparagus officinalis]|uniref:uncharacterized protein LOC109825011 isoform X2 n=1 Tax=Asparagus officinalis TaxID=4686 RepID=UPI00098DF038|nr:uncharacterized protein LOC109825011 isoform X2 [Asparagus officinalis]